MQQFTAIFDDLHDRFPIQVAGQRQAEQMFAPQDNRPALDERGASVM